MAFSTSHSTRTYCHYDSAGAAPEIDQISNVELIVRGVVCLHVAPAVEAADKT